MSDHLNRKGWARELKKNQLLYPDERVVSFLSANFPDRNQNTNYKALDIGFSSGRHLSLLRDYNFQIYGIDYNNDAVENVHSIFGEEIGSNIRAADIAEDPFPKEYFDAIVYYGVAFLRPLERMRTDLLSARNMLKKGGKMIVNFRSKDNWFYGKGTSQDNQTFLLDLSAGPYANLQYTFLDQEQASNLLNDTGFLICNYEKFDLYKKNATEQHSWHIFWVE